MRKVGMCVWIVVWALAMGATVVRGEEPRSSAAAGANKTAPPKKAVEKSPEPVASQLEILGQRLEQQAAELKQMRAELQRLRALLQQEKAEAPASSAPESTAAAVAPAPPREDAPATPAVPATQAQNEGGLFRNDRLQLGGYASFRFEANNVGGNALIPGGSAKAFTFRRFVLTTDMQLTNRIRVYSETEFERLLEMEVEKEAGPRAGGLRFAQGVEGNNGAEIGMEQLWLQYDLGRGQGIRAGLVLPPLGRFNILHDDDYWDLPRRTLVDRDAPVVPVKVAWREPGAGLVGSLGVGTSGKLDYQFYVTGGSTIDFNFEHVANTRAGDTTKQALEAELGISGGGVDGSKNAGALAWRVAYAPSLAGEIAISGYHAKYTPGFLPVTERVNAFGLDGKWRYRGFAVEGEFIWSGFGNVSRVAQSLAGTALTSAAEAEVGGLESEAEIELGGLARRRYGFWTDFKYYWRPAFLKKSFLGRDFEDPQLIPIVRYERVWLDQDLDTLEFSAGSVTNLSFANREQDRITLGLNYRPVQQVGVQFAYEHNQRRRGAGLIFPRVPQSSSNGFLMGLIFSY